MEGKKKRFSSLATISRIGFNIRVINIGDGVVHIWTSVFVINGLDRQNGWTVEITRNTGLSGPLIVETDCSDEDITV